MSVVLEAPLRPLALRSLLLAGHWGRAVLVFSRRHPLGALGALLTLTALTLALVAPLLAPYDPTEIFYGRQLRAPSEQFPLGTDSYGRDVLSRLLWGARVSLVVGISSVAIGVLGGTLLGLVSGYWAGTRFDTLLQRLMDALMAFPTLILALIISASLGSSILSVIVAISLAFAPEVQRIIRSAAITVREAPFIEAATVVGCGTPRILFVHVLPQCIPSGLVIATTLLGQAIIVESAISFVGAGPAPPTPTWGNMLSEAVHFAEQAPWLAVFSGMAISLSVYGFNLLGDALRDALDPRLRS